MTTNHTPRTRKRTARLLVACGVVGGALVLGLAAAGGTLALLSSSQTVPGATVTAGSLDLTVNGASTASLGGRSVLPGVPQVFPITVANTGTTPTALTTTITVTSAAAINDRLKARVTPVADAAACVPGLAGAQGALSGHTAAELASLTAGGSTVVCLEIALDEATPISLSGQSASFTATVTATQKGR